MGDPSQFHRPGGRRHHTAITHTINPRTASYAIIFDACRLRALRGHQGSHHPPASCLGRGRVQNPEAMCLPFPWPYPVSLLPILAHYQRFVPDTLDLFMT